MADHEKNARGTDATMLDDGDRTKLESDRTVMESVSTVFERDAAMPETTLSDTQTQGQTERSNADFKKGEVLLDTYKIESDAIKGGMGSVWRVHHAGWDVDLAMKRPQPQCFSDEKSKLDFIRECDTWISLGLHPNIVSCYYVRLVGGVPTIFSEWMDGGDLAHAIDDGSLYENLTDKPAQVQERILDIAIQFARGLYYAHEAKDEAGKCRDLIHQDVKPGNVLLAKSGEVKVSDFGLLKAAETLVRSESADGLSSQHLDDTVSKLRINGTPAYCSAEQMEHKPLTLKTDIYSWAVSVLEMYVGGHTWANGSVVGMDCQRYFEQACVPVPKPVKDLLKRCLATEPEDRPHDFGLIIAELRAIYQLETGGAYPREAGGTTSDTADSLNNRALSMLDLGKPAEAEKLWNRALHANAQNPAANYNYWLRRWESADCRGAEALTRLQEAKVPEAVIQRMERRYAPRLLRHVENASKGGFGWPVVNPDGKLLAYSVKDDDGKPVIVLRSLDTGEELAVLRGHSGRFVGRLAFLSGGKHRLVSCGDDATLRVWDAETGQCVFMQQEAAKENKNRQAGQPDDGMPEADGSADRNAFHDFLLMPDGRHALTIGHNRGLMLWPLYEGGQATLLNSQQYIMALALHPDGQHVFLAHGQAIYRGSLSGGDLEPWLHRMFFERHAFVRQVFVTPNGEDIVTADEKVTIWDAERRKMRRELLPWAPGVALSNDGALILCWGSTSKTVELWRREDGALLHEFQDAGPAFMGAFAPDGRIILLCEDGGIRVYSAVTVREQTDFIVSRIEALGERQKQEARFSALLDEATQKLMAIETAFDSEWTAACRRDPEQGLFANDNAARQFQQIFELMEETGRIPGMEYDDRLLSLRERAGKFCRVRDVRSTLLPLTYRLFSPGWHRSETLADPNREHLLNQGFLPDGRLLLLYDYGIRLLNPDSLGIEAEEPLEKAPSYGWRIYRDESAGLGWKDRPRARRISNDGVLVKEDFAFWRGEYQPDKFFGVARRRLKVYEEETGKLLCSYLFGDSGNTMYGEMIHGSDGSVYRLNPPKTAGSIENGQIKNQRFELVRQSLFDGSMHALGDLEIEKSGIVDHVKGFVVTQNEKMAAAMVGKQLISMNFQNGVRFQAEGNEPIALLPSGFVLCGSNSYDRQLKLLDPRTGTERIVSLGIPPGHDVRFFSHISVSQNGARAAVVFDDYEYILRLVYDYAFTGWSDDATEADPYLIAFLAQTSAGTETELRGLRETLQYAGLGNLRPKAILDRLDALRRTSPGGELSLLDYLKARNPEGEPDEMCFLDRPASGPESFQEEQARMQEEHQSMQNRYNRAPNRQAVSPIKPTVSAPSAKPAAIPKAWIPGRCQGEPGGTPTRIVTVTGKDSIAIWSPEEAKKLLSLTFNGAQMAFAACDAAVSRVFTVWMTGKKEGVIRLYRLSADGRSVSLTGERKERDIGGVVVHPTHGFCVVITSDSKFGEVLDGEKCKPMLRLTAVSKDSDFFYKMMERKSDAPEISATSSDGQKAVVSSVKNGDGCLVTNSLKQWSIPPAPDFAINALRFSPDGRFLILTGKRGGEFTAQIWNARTGQIAGELPILNKNQFRNLLYGCFSADSRMVYLVFDTGVTMFQME